MENEEEKKIAEETSIKNEDAAPAEEESDFADEIKPSVEETPVEEKPVEEEETPINLYAEEEETEQKEETPTIPEQKDENKIESSSKKGKNKKKEEITYTYEDSELASVEEARKEFHTIYHKLNVYKWIGTAVGLVLIVLGWVIPSVIQGINANITMYVSLGVTVAVLVALAVFSSIFRKKVDAAMKIYFKKYYEHTCKYIFPTSVENLTGTVDDKLPQETFLESKIYNDVVKVGSRAYMTFTYKGFNGVVADCAAQKKGDRQLQTLFVGKFLKFEGITSTDEILIYFKGNKRALPPNSLHGRKLIEDSKSMVIYGSGKARTILTKKVRDALAKFDTNKTFIDMAIAINDKGTYFAMGYEDDLMVLPLEKPFNPAPTTQNKNDIEKVLNLVDAFVYKHGEEK